MNSNELLNCGPCGNVLCSQYGCLKQRGGHPFWNNVIPVFQADPVFDEVGQRIAELERRVNDLENRLTALEMKP